jgi:ribosome-binding factor A
MSSRIEQVNSLLMKELAIIISREMPINDCLVTVSYVKCSPDLRYAKIGISVLPENMAGQILRKLKERSVSFSSLIKKKVRFKMIPKFHWEIDHTESRASEIEEILKQIKNEG